MYRERRAERQADESRQGSHDLGQRGQAPPSGQAV